MFNGKKKDCRSGLQNWPSCLHMHLERLVTILRGFAPCIKLVRLENRHPSIIALYIDVQMASMWLICLLITLTPLRIRANQVGESRAVVGVSALWWQCTCTSTVRPGSRHMVTRHVSASTRTRGLNSIPHPFSISPLTAAYLFHGIL